MMADAANHLRVGLRECGIDPKQAVIALPYEAFHALKAKLAFDMGLHPASGREISTKFELAGITFRLGTT